MDPSQIFEEKIIPELQYLSTLLKNIENRISDLDVRVGSVEESLDMLKRRFMPEMPKRSSSLRAGYEGRDQRI